MQNETDRSRPADTSNTDFPRIPYSLLEHKTSIAISWAIIFTGSCIIPILLYFVLKDVAHLKAAIVLGVPTGIFGATSVFSYLHRLYSLLRKDSTTRPINSPSRATLDYFHWNFTLGFCYITALICYATASTPARPRVVAIPLSLMLLQVCSQILIGATMGALGFRYPFRFSSLPRGDPIRPATYTLVEDIIAVDAGQGTAYRVSLDRAYRGRPAVRKIFQRLNLLWGVSGLRVGAMDLGLIFGLKNVDIAWVIGWAVPWAWGAIFTLISLVITRAELRKENMEIGRTGKTGEFTTVV